ncbi:MAG: oligosaccharide flippase family protein [Sedimentisphaerales bacterium]|nr:oligosaccharide flippase family protein [Sedimentisphaerales bacterium]
MVEKLKGVWGRNRRVLSNFFSLSVLQYTTYLVPLITLPYLVRVLGPARYGLVEFARAFSVYFVVFTEYGFSLSATQQISVHRDDPHKVSEIFSAVLVVRLLLLLVSLLFLGLLILGVPKVRAEWPVFVFAFGTVLGQCLFPVWLFQGLERMKQIAVLHVAARILITVSIFVFIRRSSDYLYVPLVQSSGIVLMGVSGLILALRVLPVRFAFPTPAALRHQIVSGWHLFISRVAVTLCTTSNVVILGLLAEDVFVAYYAAGEKIVRAVTDALHIPLSQAVFPHVGKLAARSKAAALNFTRRVARVGSVVALALSAGLYLGAGHLTRLVLGPGFEASVIVVRILSLLPFIVGFNHILGIQIMANFGFQKTLARILAAAGVLNIVVVLALVLPLKHVGVAIASLTTETLIVVAMFVALRKKGLNVFAPSDESSDNHQVVT